jgi:hypothetical protein
MCTDFSWHSFSELDFCVIYRNKTITLKKFFIIFSEESLFEKINKFQIFSKYLEI